MAAILQNGWYISANQYDVGVSSGTPTAYQTHNAQKVYDTFSALGWTRNAIAGMVGNMQYESCLDPACVYPKSNFPNGGASLEDLDNTYAIELTSPAYGLVQWKGTTSTAPAGNQLVSYAIRHNSQWYEGQIQMERLTWEYQNAQKWHSTTIDGVTWTFAMYAASNESADTLAYIFMRCYEGTYSVVDKRKANALYWYSAFGGMPEGWVSGTTFANYALSYNGQYIPYDECDCIGFVNKVWQDIPATSGSITSGTNSLWRSTRTFNTTSPNGTSPCPELWYKATIETVETVYGAIPAGTLLFHKISDAGPPPIPSQYADDGIGNFAHVGIYCGNNQVMQSGGRDSSSVPGGGVHLSEYDASAWNYCAFLVYVDCAYAPGHRSIPPWLLFKFKGRGLAFK